MEIKEIYQIKTFGGEEHDTQVPLKLAESFIVLKEKFEEISNGKYYCTPLVFEKNEKGVSVGIIEIKDDGTHVKLPFNLTIK
jgi:hypothetical protein